MAFISDDLANGVINQLAANDGAEKVTSVDCTNLCQEELMMTTCLVSRPDMHMENSVGECVWETCGTVPVRHINSDASKRRLHEDRSEEWELQFDCSLKPQNRVKHKNGAKRKNKRKAKKKVKKHCSSGKAILDPLIDSCPPAEKALLQVCEDDGPSAVSPVTNATTNSVENSADHTTELSAALDCNIDRHLSITITGKISACNDDGVDLLHAAAQSTCVSCEELVELQGKSLCTENSDENKNILSDDILLEKECREKVELPTCATVLTSCNLVPANNDNTVYCRMNNSFIESTGSECVPGCVEEDIFACELEKTEMLTKNKRRRSQRLKAIFSTHLELVNENELCCERDGLSAVEEQEGCVQYTAFQDAKIAGDEDQCAGFTGNTSNISTTSYLPCVNADELTTNQCLVENDFDDIDDFPIYTERSSRKLRRTSIKLYRKSLHDAENTEEQCDMESSAGKTENEKPALDVEMNYTNDDAMHNELVLLPTESSHFTTLSALEDVDQQSLDVQIDKLPLVTNTNSVVKPETDSSSANTTRSQRRRRSTANYSQVSLTVPVALPPKTRQRKPSTSVEDIYLNRLWRSQMPKEKALESIPELPTSEQHGSKVTKHLRCLKFADDAPNRTKLRQRRQKAVKNGWKPITKKQNALLDSQLSDKLAQIESDSVLT